MNKVFISKITLKNFRCHDEKTINLKEGINIIVGENGKGKTSFIEALNIFSSGKSYRNADIKNVIKIKKDKATVEIEIQRKQKITKKIIITKEKRENKKAITASIFSPETADLINQEPKKRRENLDAVLSLLETNYSNKTQIYNQILANRNKLLQKANNTNNEKINEQLKLWNLKFCLASVEITQKRKKLLEEIQKNIEEAKFQLETTPKKATVEEMKKTIIENLQKEKILGFSLEGAQKDDVKIALNSLKAKGNASQGEKWLTMLKFINEENKIVKKKNFRKPNVLLLDDLFVGLDKNNQQKAIDLLDEKQQVIITTTSIENLKNKAKYNIISL